MVYETSDARNDDDGDEISAEESIQPIPVTSRRKNDSMHETSTSVFSSVDEESDDFIATPKRKSPTKKQQSATVTASTSSPSRSLRLIHTSKKRVVVETKGGKTATKMKTVVTRTTNLPEKIAPATNVSGTRKSSRTKPIINKLEPPATVTTPTTTKSLTNGSFKTRKSSPVVLAQQGPPSNNRNNLYAELSAKSSNFSSDVVSDLEEILGSPIKTSDFNNEKPKRGRSNYRTSNSESSETMHIDNVAHTEYLIDSQIDSIKPNTRSSKRLSARVRQTPIVETITKPPTPKPIRTSKLTQKLNTIYMDEHEQSSEDSQDASIDQRVANNSPNVVLNIKQEKEVSFTMTDENSVFTCEMCSAVFSDRAQLLVHVPVHI